MIQQKLLPIKFERSDDEVTSRSGLVLFDEFIKAFGLKGVLGRHMPLPGSNRGFKPWRYIEPLVLMLYGGGRHIEDLRELREDRALLGATQMGEIPSCSAYGDWLVRMGGGQGLVGLHRVIEEFTRKVLRRDEHAEYTLWSDPTIIEADKREAEMTYQGGRGYRPIVTAFKEMPVVVWHRFRPGNAMGGVLEALKGAYRLLPPGKRIKHAALDSEFYTADVINYLRSEGTTFTIVADEDEAVKGAIGAIPQGEWRPYFDKDGVKTDRELAVTVHCMEKTEAFSLVVLRWTSRQRDLFCGDEYRYHAIATDLEVEPEEAIVQHQESHPEQACVWRYNERGQMENIIKELKVGMGMEQMPSGSFEANAMYFAIGALAYNLYVAHKYFVIGEGYQKRTIHSLRWSLIQIPGKLIRHAGRLILKIAASVEKFGHYMRMRQRHLALLLEPG